MVCVCVCVVKPKPKAKLLQYLALSRVVKPTSHINIVIALSNTRALAHSHTRASVRACMYNNNIIFLVIKS